MDRAPSSSPQTFRGSSPPHPPSPSAADNATPDGQPSFMEIKVVRDESVVVFKVKPATKFSKVMDAYCKLKNVDKGTLRFYLDGKRIEDTDTPLTLEMMDDDNVQVFTEQIGGGLLLFRSPDSSPSQPAEPSNVAAPAVRHPITSINIMVTDVAKKKDVFVKIQSSSKFERLMDCYCKLVDKDPHSLRFLFNDKRIMADDTAHGLAMKDGDVIEVME